MDMNLSLSTDACAAPRLLLRRMTLGFGAALLLGASAWVRIPLPFTPVPVTLQTFALLLLAASLRGSVAPMMVLWYLALGALGMPWFALGNGLSALTGPTGGYLFGFLLAASVVGSGIPLLRHRLARLLLFAVGALLVYVPGLLQLKLVTGSTWSATIALGWAPFVWGDLIKAAAAWSAWELPRAAASRR